MSDKAVITCALNGVLTDPKQHNVPVTPEEMAREARAAFNATPAWSAAMAIVSPRAGADRCPSLMPHEFSAGAAETAEDTISRGRIRATALSIRIARREGRAQAKDARKSALLRIRVKSK